MRSINNPIEVTVAADQMHDKLRHAVAEVLDLEKGEVIDNDLAVDAILDAIARLIDDVTRNDDDLRYAHTMGKINQRIADIRSERKSRRGVVIL